MVVDARFIAYRARANGMRRDKSHLCERKYEVVFIYRLYATIPESLIVKPSFSPWHLSDHQ